MSISLELEVVTCWECGIQFAVPQLWFNEKCGGEDGVYCPNAHENFYLKPPPPDSPKSCTQGMREQRETQELRR